MDPRANVPSSHAHGGRELATMFGLLHLPQGLPQGRAIKSFG